MFGNGPQIGVLALESAEGHRTIEQLNGDLQSKVEKISEQLNVTKGSFYHHNDAKDELVVECFERTFEGISEAAKAKFYCENFQAMLAARP